MSAHRYNPDAPLYIVMCDFGPQSGLEAIVQPGTTMNSIVTDIIAARYTCPQYVLEIRDGVERNVSEDIARTIVGLAEQEGADLEDWAIAFCQEYEALPVDCSAFERGAVVRSEAA